MDSIEKFENSSHIIGVIEKDKSYLADSWVKQPLTSIALKKHSINKKFFSKHFGVRVIQYFIDVIQKKEAIGDCPVVIVMLHFFKRKNIPLNDLFIICSGLKNTVINYIYTENVINESILLEIEYAMDKNFEGIMVEYSAMFEDTNKVFTLNASKNEPDDVIIKRTYSEDILDSHFLELKELEEDISDLSVMISMGRSGSDTLSKITEDLNGYGTILTNYSFSKDLGFAIMDLSNALLEHRDFIDSMDDKEKMSIILDGFINDLMEWRKCMFETGIESYDSMNPSIISSIESLITIVSGSEINEDSEVELF